MRRRGRKESKRARERRAKLTEKLYATPVVRDVEEHDEDWVTSELRRLRTEAREIIRRHPGNARMWRVAADFLLKAARLEHAMKGRGKDSQREAILKTFEQLDSQLNPVRWRFEEKDPDRVVLDGPEMASGEE